MMGALHGPAIDAPENARKTEFVQAVIIRKYSSMNNDVMILRGAMGFERSISLLISVFTCNQTVLILKEQCNVVKIQINL